MEASRGQLYPDDQELVNHTASRFLENPSSYPEKNKQHIVWFLKQKSMDMEQPL